MTARRFRARPRRDSRCRSCGSVTRPSRSQVGREKMNHAAAAIMPETAADAPIIGKAW
jgi:hypothetical protein